jgi:hypothetical protein
MTVTVTLQGGATDRYMRFGDEYVKHNDGTLDVIRDGAKRAISLRAGRVGRREGQRKAIEEKPFLGLIQTGTREVLATAEHSAEAQRES